MFPPLRWGACTVNCGCRSDPGIGSDYEQPLGIKMNGLGDFH